MLSRLKHNDGPSRSQKIRFPKKELSEADVRMQNSLAVDLLNIKGFNSISNNNNQTFGVNESFNPKAPEKKCI